MLYPALRQVFESMAPASASHEARVHGAARFVDHIRGLLGLRQNAMGRPVVQEAQMSPREFSLRGLAEAMCGYEWAENLGRANAAAHQVFEAGGGPGNVAMTPGNLPNVSAYLGSVTGLLEASVLKAYDNPEFIIDSLIETVPSKTRQRSMIGAGRIGDQAARRNPGEGHQFAQFAERKIVTQETYNDALAGAVTFEAVYFDQTGQVLDHMNAIGNELGLRKEYDGFKLIAGITNPYNYNGVAYNTYLTSGNWINDGSNVLTDWTSLNVMHALLNRMTDQETGTRIAVSVDTLLVSPNNVETANYIQTATWVRSYTQSATVVAESPNRAPRYRVVSSPYLDYLLTLASASGGLGLSQTNADKYWWGIKTGPGGAFIRTENWPLSINRASPNDFTMLNQKLLLAVFTDQMHSFDVREPRFVIRNKN